MRAVERQRPGWSDGSAQPQRLAQLRSLDNGRQPSASQIVPEPAAPGRGHDRPCGPGVTCTSSRVRCVR
jgi:hypothetical protein